MHNNVIRMFPRKEVNRVRVAQRLRAAREAQGVSQSSLAEQTGWSRQEVNRVENDKRPPGSWMLKALCAVHASISWGGR